MVTKLSVLSAQAFLFSLLGVSLISGVAPASAYTIYTDRASWIAALTGAPIITDTFSNIISSAQSITLDSGIISTNSSPPMLPNMFNNNSVSVVSPGAYDNATQAITGSASDNVTWLFPTAITAFGADFIGAGGGRLTLNGDFDGTGLQSLTVNATIGGADGFLGVIGSTTFTSVVLSNPSTQVDAFSIDNASFAPVPGPLPVLGASASFAWSRRLRQRIAAHARRSTGKDLAE